MLLPNGEAIIRFGIVEKDDPLQWKRNWGYTPKHVLSKLALIHTDDLGRPLGPIGPASYWFANNMPPK